VLTIYTRKSPINLQTISFVADCWAALPERRPQKKNVKNFLIFIHIWTSYVQLLHGQCPKNAPKKQRYQRRKDWKPKINKIQRHRGHRQVMLRGRGSAKGTKVKKKIKLNKRDPCTRVHKGKLTATTTDRH